jgi:hypothetical protein
MAVNPTCECFYNGGVEGGPRGLLAKCQISGWPNVVFFSGVDVCVGFHELYQVIILISSLILVFEVNIGEECTKYKFSIHCQKKYI